MDIKEMRTASAEDRAKELTELMRQQFSLRMQKATGQLSNTSQLRNVRRDIARLRTVMSEGGKIGATAAPKAAKKAPEKAKAPKAAAKARTRKASKA